MGAHTSGVLQSNTLSLEVKSIQECIGDVWKFKETILTAFPIPLVLQTPLTYGLPYY